MLWQPVPKTLMKKIQDIIDLETNTPAKKVSFATRYLVEMNFTFDLTIRSNDFSGKSHFCVRRDEIDTFCNDLMKMHSSLTGSSQLNDNDSDSLINFTIHENGHLVVSGQA